MNRWVIIDGWGTLDFQIKCQVAHNLRSDAGKGKGRKARRRARVIEGRILANVGPSGFTPQQWRVISFANGC